VRNCEPRDEGKKPSVEIYQRSIRAGKAPTEAGLGEWSRLRLECFLVSGAVGLALARDAFT